MSTTILMPALSPTMEEGKLAKWHVKEGDAVKTGDILAEIETDKATMEFEAIDEGRIGKLLVPEGAEGIKVNAPIAVLLGEDEAAGAAPPPSKPEEISAVMKEIKQAIAPAKSTPSPLVGEGAAPRAAKQRAFGAAGEGEGRPNGARIFASPLAKRIAAQKGVDLSTLQGTGPRGRIVKADVEAAKPGAQKISSPLVGEGAPKARVGGEPPAPMPAGISPLPDARLFYRAGEYQELPHDSMRKTIARRLASAKTLIPHYYLTIDCDLGALMESRSRLNARSPQGPDGKTAAYKLSINDFLVKAAALALMKHPDVNASWTDTAILKHKHADVGVAVDLAPGLITPIVFRAEDKGLVDISNEVKSLAERAKAKKLKPQEFEGGSFSISNLGMFGIKNFTAVINPPQSAILAVGAGEERAVVRGGKIVSAMMMTVTMSCDHRVVDGAAGARFLKTFKDFVEEPASMLL